MAAIGRARQCPAPGRRLPPARRMEAPPPRGFSEERFRAACRELDQPAPAAGGPWQLLVESMGVRIYRLYDEVGGGGGSPAPGGGRASGPPRALRRGARLRSGAGRGPGRAGGAWLAGQGSAGTSPSRAAGSPRRPG